MRSKFLSLNILVLMALLIITVTSCTTSNGTFSGDNGGSGDGTYTLIPEIQVRQGNTNIPSDGGFYFGSVSIDTQNEVTFIVENMGTDDLNLTGLPDKVEGSGMDALLFTITSQPASPIFPGGNSPFIVRFSTSSSGAKTATLTIANDDPTENSFTFTITATGIVPPAEIPDTGQTTSHATGDDGDLEKGVSWPLQRFVDNGDDTVTDKLTGLMWQQTPSSATRTWANTITYADGVVTGDYTDWRLPNVNELASLLNAEESSSASWLEDHGFSNLQNEYYWSSTTFAPDTEYAWLVDMGFGSAGLSGCVTEGRKAGDYGMFGLIYYPAWCVRDSISGTVFLPQTGQATSYATGDDGDLENGAIWPSPRFIDNDNGTVTDGLTGLMWEQQPSYSIMTWDYAVAGAADLTVAGYTDWRLPNRSELRSLCNYGLSNSVVWLNDQAFDWIQTFYYWTSTPYPVGTTYAWIVFMTRAQVFLEYKVPSPAFRKPAWYVRGGQ